MLEKNTTEMINYSNCTILLTNYLKYLNLAKIIFFEKNKIKLVSYLPKHPRFLSGV